MNTKTKRVFDFNALEKPLKDIDVIYKSLKNSRVKYKKNEGGHPNRIIKWKRRDSTIKKNISCELMITLTETPDDYSTYDVIGYVEKGNIFKTEFFFYKIILRKNVSPPFTEEFANDIKKYMCGIDAIRELQLDQKAVMRSPVPFVPFWMYYSFLFLTNIIILPFTLLIGLIQNIFDKNKKDTIDKS